MHRLSSQCAQLWVSPAHPQRRDMSALLQRLARSGASQVVALTDALTAVQAELRPAGGAAAWRVQRRHAASAAGGSEEQPPAASAPATGEAQAPAAAEQPSSAAAAASAPKQAAKPAVGKPAAKQGKQQQAGSKQKPAAGAQQPEGKAKAAKPDAGSAVTAPPSRLSGKQVSVFHASLRTGEWAYHVLCPGNAAFVNMR